MQRSFKFLYILTNASAESHWCDYELRIACHRNVLEARDSVIIIQKEPVSPTDMPPQLRSLTKLTTYLEWTDKEDEQPEFWRRLKEALVIHDVAPLRCYNCNKYVKMTTERDHETGDRVLMETTPLLTENW